MAAFDRLDLTPLFSFTVMKLFYMDGTLVGLAVALMQALMPSLRLL
jgi:hypothetical protein